MQRRGATHMQACCSGCGSHTADADSVRPSGRGAHFLAQSCARFMRASPTYTPSPLFRLSATSLHFGRAGLSVCRKTVYRSCGSSHRRHKHRRGSFENFAQRCITSIACRTLARRMNCGACEASEQNPLVLTAPLQLWRLPQEDSQSGWTPDAALNNNAPTLNNMRSAS